LRARRYNDFRKSADRITPAQGLHPACDCTYLALELRLAGTISPRLQGDLYPSSEKPEFTAPGPRAAVSKGAL
jgi:hypothetical protein